MQPKLEDNLAGELWLSELPGQRIRCCGLRLWESQPLIVHRSHWQEKLRNGEWAINRDGSWDQTAYTCHSGFHREEVKSIVTLPNDKLIVL